MLGWFRKKFASTPTPTPSPISDEAPSAILRSPRPKVRSNHIGRGSIPVAFDTFSGALYGGPYRDRPCNIMGVKLAPEIDAPFDIRVDIKDFSIPNTVELEFGLMAALVMLYNHGCAYCGCMGGQGRTGLFMAAMAKVMLEHGDAEGLPLKNGKRTSDPVTWVRDWYLSHAVETKEQELYVREFKTERVRTFLTILDTP